LRGFTFVFLLLQGLFMGAAQEQTAELEYKYNLHCVSSYLHCYFCYICFDSMRTPPMTTQPHYIRYKIADVSRVREVARAVEASVKQSNIVEVPTEQM
jgi:oligoribonuclease (3'-5' exoribonuclease)